MIETQLAQVPLLDWSGPDFLRFYVGALIASIFWVVLAAKIRAKRFEPRSLPAIPQDPYEIAFLAGGPPRVIQLALARLVDQQVAAWDPATKLLKVNSAVAPDSLNPVETAVLLRLLESPKGVRMEDLKFTAAGPLKTIEAKLASTGLRPSAAESGRYWKGVFFPMVLLLLLGAVKLMIGLTREKPVTILVLLLFATVVGMLILRFALQRKYGRVTKAGREVIQYLRDQPKWSQDSASVVMPGLAWQTLALVGPLAVCDLIGADFSNGLQKLSPISYAGGGNSGCGGATSSCGSSGCGGSGCGGGCGGCGGGD